MRCSAASRLQQPLIMLVVIIPNLSPSAARRCYGRTRGAVSYGGGQPTSGVEE